MTRPYKNTPLQVAYDRKHEQLRKEVAAMKAARKPRVRVKARRAVV